MADASEQQAVVEALAQAGMGKPLRITPVPVGASNSVYEVSLPHRHVAVRAAVHSADRYVVERMAMDWARAVGVPCPTVHAIVEVGEYAVTVSEWLPGTRLA